MAKNQPYPESDTGDAMSLNTNHLLHAILYGGKCLSYEQLVFDDAPAVVLPNIPVNARSAIIVIENTGGAMADENKIARFREDGTAPTADIGMPLGNNGSVEVKGSQNLAEFQIIGIDAGATHILRVQYYGPE
jgi:hypothetical protein